ncbi:hypothetical protein A2U01_0093913, partial [Trifolium medium]|nr:hypothetical protein [Trifolium medium]
MVMISAATVVIPAVIPCNGEGGCGYDGCRGVVLSSDD